MLTLPAAQHRVPVTNPASHLSTASRFRGAGVTRTGPRNRPHRLHLLFSEESDLGWGGAMGVWCRADTAGHTLGRGRGRQREGKPLGDRLSNPAARALPLGLSGVCPTSSRWDRCHQEPGPCGETCDGQQPAGREETDVPGEGS